MYKNVRFVAAKCVLCSNFSGSDYRGPPIILYRKHLKIRPTEL